MRATRAADCAWATGETANNPVRNATIHALDRSRQIPRRTCFSFHEEITVHCDYAATRGAFFSNPHVIPCRAVATFIACIAHPPRLDQQ